MLYNFFEFILSNNKIFGIDKDILTLVLIPVFFGLMRFFEFLISKTIEVLKQENQTSQNTQTTEINFNPSTEGDVYDIMKDKTDEEKNIETELTIRSLLDKIRKELGADRVFLAKFHNGEKRNEIYPGNIYQVYTIISESLADGVSSEKGYFSNIPIGFYKTVLDEILNNKWIFINDINKIQSNELRYVLRHLGIKSYGAVGIFNVSDDMVGILGIEFVKGKKDITQDDLDILRRNAHYFVEYIKRYKIKK